LAATARESGAGGTDRGATASADAVSRALSRIGLTPRRPATGRGRCGRAGWLRAGPARPRGPRRGRRCPRRTARRPPRTGTCPGRGRRRRSRSGRRPTRTRRLPPAGHSPPRRRTTAPGCDWSACTGSDTCAEGRCRADAGPTRRRRSRQRAAGLDAPRRREQPGLRPPRRRTRRSLSVETEELTSGWDCPAGHHGAARACRARAISPAARTGPFPAYGANVTSKARWVTAV
jgi:hypothetical protein